MTAAAVRLRRRGLTRTKKATTTTTTTTTFCRVFYYRSAMRTFCRQQRLRMVRNGNSSSSSSSSRYKFQFTGKAIVDIRLRPRCAIPAPTSRPIVSSTRPTLAIKRLPLSCARRCVGHSNSQLLGVFGLSATCCPQNYPFLL